MAATFRAAGTKTNGTGGQSSISVGVPAGIVAGDLLVLVGTCYQSLQFATPSGWTLLGDSGGYAALSRYRSQAFWKIAGASESSVTLATTSGTGFLDGQMFAWQDVDTGTTIDVNGGFGAVSTTTSVAVPALTTTVNNCLMIYIGFDTGGGVGDYWTTPPTGSTERAESGTNIGRFIVADELRATAGTESAQTYVRTDTQSALAMSFAVRPVAAAASTFVPQINIT